MIFLNALKKIESAFYTVNKKNVERPKVYKVMRVYDTSDYKIYALYANSTPT